MNDERHCTTVCKIGRKAASITPVASRGSNSCTSGANTINIARCHGHNEEYIYNNKHGLLVEGYHHGIQVLQRSKIKCKIINTGLYSLLCPIMEQYK